MHRLITLPSIRRWVKRRRPLPVALRIVGGLAVLVIIGTALLMLPGAGAQGRLSFMEALFTATSALSVTGLSIIVPSQDLTLFGQLVLLLLIQLGGVGFMVNAVVVFSLLGRRISLLNRMALIDSLGLIMPGAVLWLVRRVLVTVLVLEGLGALLLWLHWREGLGDQQAIFYAIFHAVSAFCNAGFDLFSGLATHPAGVPNDNITLVLLGTLIFVGGLGIPVLAEVLSLHRERRISLHTRLTLVVVISLVCAGGLGIFLAERAAGGLLHAEPWSRQLLLAFFQSISTRTAGFAGIQPFPEITPASELLILVLMFIGAAPASMGGGITTGTFTVLILSMWAFARGWTTPRVGGRSISPHSGRKAASVLTISLFVVLLCTWLLLMTHALPLDMVVFEVVSAFATCGLTMGATTQLNTFGQAIIVLVMFWGRLGALTIVVALAQTRPRQLIEYPEENILIG